MESNIDAFISAGISDFENDECTICLEMIDDDYKILECNHIFHNSCFMKYCIFKRENITCPLCRTELLQDTQLDTNPIDLFRLNNNSTHYAINNESIDTLSFSRRIMLLIVCIICTSIIGYIVRIITIHAETYYINYQHNITDFNYTY